MPVSRSTNPSVSKTARTGAVKLYVPSQTIPGRCSMKSSVSFLLLLGVLTIANISQVVDASITIAETGQVFDSKPERYVGQRLWKGYEYMGRLQYLAENPTLCPPPSSLSPSTTTTTNSADESDDRDQNGSVLSFDDLHRQLEQEQKKFRIIQPTDGVPGGSPVATASTKKSSCCLVWFVWFIVCLIFTYLKLFFCFFFVRG